MVTQAFRDWEARGEPYTLCDPVEDLALWAVKNDVRVLGTIGNGPHLRSDHPRDHTPFSSTQWPVKIGEPVVFAIDLANVTRDGRTLGEAIEAQFRAGKLPWLKYMNHAHRHIDSRDIDGDGKRYEVEDSSDGHVHLSMRTDWWKRSIGEFNPWDHKEEDIVATVDQVWNDPSISLTESTAKRLVGAEKGTQRSPANLLQNVVIDAQDAKDLGEATVKRLIAVEAQAGQNGAALTELRTAIGDIARAVTMLLERLDPDPVAKPDPVVKKAGK